MNEEKEAVAGGNDQQNEQPDADLGSGASTTSAPGEDAPATAEDPPADKGNPDEQSRGYRPYTLDVGPGLIESLMGRRNIHEIGVNGSVLEQTAKFVETNLRPEVGELELDDGSVAVVEVSRGGLRVLDPALFDAWRDVPRFRAGVATMLALDSFIAHVIRFGDPDSAVFADNDRDNPSLTAVLDYHRTGAEGEARFGRHRTRFAFPLADEWNAWRSLNGKVLKMADFARFLDDRIIDVLPATAVSLGDEEQGYLDALGTRAVIADPSRLMDLASGLQINQHSVVKEVQNLQDGTGTLVFESVHTDQAGQKLVIPGLFVLGIPVFRNGERYQVIARLRYRMDPGTGIVFWYELWRLDRVFDAAFNEAVVRVQVEADVPVFVGVDEGDCSPVAPDADFDHGGLR